MASLHLLCSTSTNNPSAAPCLLYPKPSHLITIAKRTHRLQVSCTADGQGQKHTPESIETSQVKVDRRNMLFGLGGLYGATNLISARGAAAGPIQAPELDKCGTATYETTDGQTIDVECCPPVVPEITDYVLPPVTRMKMRPAAHKVSPEYILKYNTAIDRMKRLPADDPRSFMQQANIHCAYCNGAYDQPGKGDLELQVHESWLFFPFHRWYLFFYERILGKMINDPTFALPFWNWDNPKGMTIPRMFDDPKAVIYNERRNQAHRPPALVDLGLTNGSDPLQIVSNNLTIMYNEMIGGISTPEDFLGQPYKKGTNPNPGAGTSERGSHDSVHDWVGDPRQPAREDLGNFYSAGRDPLFYSHHGNVDRMWTLWQYYLPSSMVPNNKITDPDFLNASFAFYDENGKLVRVYVKDCVSNLAMGYDYERIDLPWLNYRPPAQTATAKATRTGIKADKLADTVFPLKLDRIVRVLVPKTKKGKADELLVIENITVDPTKFFKFDVFINDEDDSFLELDKASYVGTYSRIPHKTRNKTATTSLRLKLTNVYDDMDVEDDDEVLLTLVPRHEGPGLTIGGIKIIENPPRAGN